MGHRVWDSSHRRSVFTKWAWPTNFADNNNDLRNETSTKVTYLMRETAWIANTLEDFFRSQMIRTSRLHFANSKNRALRKNAWNSVNLNSTGSHNYPQCIADMLTLQVKCVSKVSSRERLWNRSNSDANIYGRVWPTWGVNMRPCMADLRPKGLSGVSFGNVIVPSDFYANTFRFTTLREPSSEAQNTKLWIAVKGVQVVHPFANILSLKLNPILGYMFFSVTVPKICNQVFITMTSSEIRQLLKKKITTYLFLTAIPP